MRILVVNHDSKGRKTIRKILEAFGECETADKTSKAAPAFKEAWADWAPFDLMTLDISESGAEEIEALHEIRQLEDSWDIPPQKKIKILVVSSRTDKGTVMKCIQAGCDSYIVKPFEKNLLVQRLAKLGIFCRKDGSPLPASKKGPTEVKKPGIVEEISSRLKRGDINLPPFSRIALKFKELVRLGSSVDQIATLLKQDPAISAKLISVSNTPIYRGVEKNTSLEKAISRLGIKTTQQYVTAICNRTLYISADRKYSSLLEKMWKHSLACACASEIIAEQQGERPAERHFMMGLFHDIGKLLLLQVLSELEREDRFEEELNSAKIRQIFPRFHSDFGAALLKKWGFSEEYMKVAKYHHKPEAAGFDNEMIKLVHGANMLVKTIGYDLAEWTPFLPQEKDIERILRIEFGTLSDIKGQVKERMESLGHILA